MNDRFLNLLGLARKAQRLSPGHDAALAAVLQGRARLILVAADASQRLTREFTRAAEEKTPLLPISYTMQELYHATGARAAVLTLDDEGFARRARELYDREDG